MEIDFAGLEEASKKGNIVNKKKIEGLQSGIKQECNELKSIFISLMNTKTKEGLEKGIQTFNYAIPFHAKNLEIKNEGHHVIFLSDECDYFSRSFLNETEKNLNMVLTMPYYSVNFRQMCFSVLKK